MKIFSKVKKEKKDLILITEYVRLLPTKTTLTKEK